jgi:hypothetical protein
MTAWDLREAIERAIPAWLELVALILAFGIIIAISLWRRR